MSECVRLRKASGYDFFVSPRPLIPIKLARRKSGGEIEMAASERLMGWVAGTRGSEALEDSARPRELAPSQGTAPGTLPGRLAAGSVREKFSRKTPVKTREIGSPSRGAAVCGTCSSSIRKKVMGHGTPALLRQFVRGHGFGLARRPFPLLDQAARNQSASVFFQPLVEQSDNFLAEIGGMAETREFVTLQRVARSREKELPRGLGLGTKHWGLLKSRGRTITDK